MTELGRDYGLCARRERRVSDGEGLVIGEVAGLLLLAERVAAPVQRENEVGLLDDLHAIEIEVREVEQERVLVGFRAVKVPALVRGEAFRLGVHTERLVPGDDNIVRSVPPARGFLEVGSERGGMTGVAGDGVGRGE